MHFKKIIGRSLAIIAAGTYLYLALTPSNPGPLSTSPKKVGLLIFATGRYVHFVPPLIASAEHLFLPGHEHTYFVFTDHSEQLPKQPNIVPIFQKKLGWPHDTMMRYSAYNDHKDLYKDMDYMYACDADMLFVNYVGDEILGDLVGTLHPMFTWRRGTYDTNPQSTAYVAPNDGTHYFAGGFYGGSRDAFSQMVQELTDKTKQNTSHNVIALWHDESHLNRYFIDHKPSVILSPSYCYPQGWDIGYSPRLVALYKNHSYWRS
jgi:histo-blood group ABO system transferase